MAQNGNHMPKPEPIWIALGIVVWAIALALGARRRDAFIAAIDHQTQDQQARRRIVTLHSPDGRRRAAAANAQVAIAYLSRIVRELRAADR